MECYSYVRSPMDISDIPATFNNIISQLIGHIEGVFTYADDVCLFSPTYKHHIKILKEVLHIFEPFLVILFILFESYTMA